MSRQPFENLKYRIHNIPKSADLFEEFPDLKKHETLRVAELQNEFIRYLIYLYDKNSDLIRQEADLEARKARASALSGFTAYQQDWVSDKAFYFLTRVYNDRKFREWCTMQQELEENNEARWLKIDPDEKDQKKLMEAYSKKGALRTQAMEIHKALDILETEIFSDNTDLLEKANELLLTTPEKIAGAYV